MRGDGRGPAGSERLTTVDAPGTSLDTSYVYDPVGNRASMTRGTATNYAYDRADRITSAGATSYTVNADGNTTARGTDTYGYDQANRLKSATSAARRARTSTMAMAFERARR